ncbi:protein MMS22-like [Anastrepha ludens]|uniref:protein MMS22-like n=1 Tax=Anastrepha ludens TaxID=28586 RepID=UPI0023AEB08B|nr:protein MMS22-like [Anastrepha ludens]XP_053951886.1 protein MMS22-like [Anastrepha ludens]
MDFELFNLDEDDELLSTACLEATQYHLTAPQQTQTLAGAVSETVLPELQCSGEDSTHSQFAIEGFVKCGFMLAQPAHAWRQISEEEILTEFEFGVKHLLEHDAVQFLFGTAFLHIQHLWTSVRQPLNTNETHSNYQRRQQITHLLYLLLHHTSEEQWSLLRPNLDSMRRLLNRTTEIDTWKLIYFANSCKGNECNAAAYHMLHGALEWKLLDLCILYKFELCAHVAQLDNNAKPSATFMCQLERLFEDLMACSLYLYTKKRPAELLHSSPFPCTCIKECWLYVQLVLEKWELTSLAVAGEQIQFWHIFNETISKLKTQLDKFALTTVSLAEFTNWILHALVRLFGYHSNGKYVGPSHERASVDAAENFEILEQCTQQFLNGNPSEEQIRVFICLLTPTLLHWWCPRVGIPMLLWEHFHKRLNASFYAAGSAPSNLAVACASGKAYVERYRALLTHEDATHDANLSSYTLFTLLLGKNLRCLLENTATRHQAQKLLGRIYTKFSAQKFLALNETGIHHIIELFLALALCGDFVELAPKLSTKLLSIALDKIPAGRQIAVTKGHMALLILYAEQRCEIDEYVAKILQQLWAINNDLSVSKVLADALLDIFMQADDFRRGEHLLIDTWLPNFLQTCTPVEQDRSLEALHLIFGKLQGNEALIEANSELFRALNTHVLPFVKQQFACGYSQWLPQLAADFCTHSCTVPDTQAFQKLFTCFIDAPVACRQALPQFLRKVLQTDRGALIEPNVVIHVWLKSLVQLTAINEDVGQLTRFVVQLDEFRTMTNDLNVEELVQAKEPLCVFIAAVGKYYDLCATDYQRRFRIADNLNSYLRNFDKWLQSDLKQEKTEVAFRFYSFLAIVIYNCAHIVYTKSKVNCFFHVVMTRFVLPTNVQMGKAPDGKLAHLIHKIWPVLVQGIGRLNFRADPYIGKTLTDLIQKWTPHFKISPNAKVVARPFVSCLQSDNNELSLFVFEKLTNLFLATQRRQADPNACLVVTIFQEVVESIDTSGSPIDILTLRLDTFMKATSLLMLEHVMMVDEVVPSRGLLLDLFKRIVKSTTYKSSASLQALLSEHLRLLTKKHLAYYTFFFFDLLQRFAQFTPETILQIMEFLVAEVRVVEQKRGAGEDNRMRGCLQKLQQSLKGVSPN